MEQGDLVKVAHGNHLKDGGILVFNRCLLFLGAYVPAGCYLDIGVFLEPETGQVIELTGGWDRNVNEGAFEVIASVDDAEG